MSLSPQEVFRAWPQFAPGRHNDLSRWTSNLLTHLDEQYNSEQVQSHVERDIPEIHAIRIRLSNGPAQLDFYRENARNFPAFEHLLRRLGWQYVRTDLENGFVILGMYRRVAYAHLTDGTAAGLPIGLKHDETPEQLIRRVREEGVWGDSSEGRFWINPNQITDVVFPESVLTNQPMSPREMRAA